MCLIKDRTIIEVTCVQLSVNFNLNLFKVECETSYPNLYWSLSTAHFGWSPSLISEQRLRGEWSQSCPWVLSAYQGSTRYHFKSLRWRGRRSNPRSSAYEADALTTWPPLQSSYSLQCTGFRHSISYMCVKGPYL